MLKKKKRLWQNLQNYEKSTCWEKAAYDGNVFKTLKNYHVKKKKQSMAEMSSELWKIAMLKKEAEFGRNVFKTMKNYHVKKKKQIMAEMSLKLWKIAMLKNSRVWQKCLENSEKLPCWKIAEYGRNIFVLHYYVWISLKVFIHAV